MRKYIDIIKNVIEKGVESEERKGKGKRQVLGYKMRLEMEEGFKVIKKKKINLSQIINEILWLMKGDKKIEYMKEKGVKIWDEWEDEKGDMGKVYGYKWS